MIVAVNYYFPDIYKDILPSFFNQTTDKENIADCNNCIMLSDTENMQGREYFSKISKCCTYQPNIPNYLVGNILKYGNPEGKKLIREYIGNGVGVSPKGLTAGETYKLLYEKGKKFAFGKSEKLICPFYDKEKGNCNIWNARPAVCSTFFCRHNKGYKGEDFWYAVRKYLLNTEDCLSDYALFKNGIITKLNREDNNHSDLYYYEIDGKKPPDYIEVWGEFEGREQEFYIQSFELVKNISNKEFKKIAGIKNKLFLEIVAEKYSQMFDDKLPQFLKFNNEANITSLPGDNFIISAGKGSFEIQKDYLDLLFEFTGNKKTDDIIQEYKNTGSEIEKELLFDFINYRLLK